MIEPKRTKAIKYLLIGLCLILGMSFRLYWSGQKEHLIGDEVWSFAMSQCKFDVCDVNIFGEYTGAEIKRALLLDDPSLGEALSDIKSLYHDTKDYNHTNLYYTFLRLVMIGCDSVDLHILFARTTLLNLLFFIIEFFFLYKLLAIYYKNHKFILLCSLLCISVAVSGVFNTSFVRPYQLQEMAYVILAYWVTRMVQDIRHHHFCYSRKNLLITALSLTLALLTGYFSIIYICLLGASLIWELHRAQRIRTGLPFLLASLTCAMVMCYLLYRSYFNGYHGDARISSMLFAPGAAMRICGSICVWAKMITTHAVYYPVIILLAVTLVVARKQKRVLRHKLPWIIPPVVAYTLIIMCIAPYKSNRYIVAAEPLLLLVIPYVLSVCNKKSLRIACCCAVSALYLLMAHILPNTNDSYKPSPMSNYLKGENIAILSNACIVDIVSCLDNTTHYVLIRDLSELPQDTHILIIQKLRPYIEVEGEDTLHQYDYITKEGYCYVYQKKHHEQ